MSSPPARREPGIDDNGALASLLSGFIDGAQDGLSDEQIVARYRRREPAPAQVEAHDELAGLLARPTLPVAELARAAGRSLAGEDEARAFLGWLAEHLAGDR